MKNVVFNADNGNAKMDAGYHFKNGASSKSHTSRRNFIKTGCIALLAAGIAFSGCKKDDSIPTSAFDGKLTAKVENAGEYPTVSKIKALDWYGAEIVSAAYSNGDFALTFPQSPETKFLKLTHEAFTSGGVGLEDGSYGCSHDGEDFAKCVIVDTFEAYDDSNNWVADALYAKLGNPSSTYAIFIYADQNISELWGHSKDNDIQVSISLKKGWNTVYVTYNSTTDKEVWSTKEVSGLKWYLSDDEE